MNTISDKFNDYVNSHPRECLSLLLIGLCLIWQSEVAILALVIYLLYIRVFQASRWILFGLGIGMLADAALFQSIHPTFFELIRHGFTLNRQFWALIHQQKIYAAISFMLSNEMIYIIGFPVFIVNLLCLIEMIANNPHEKTMKALQKGIHPDDTEEVSDKALTKALKNARDDNHDGTLLGVSKRTGKYVVIPDRDVNQVMLVLGTTGGGKTITLRPFYQRALTKWYPLIIVDGKPDEANIKYLEKLAEQNGRPFFGFNCANHRHYDPLAHGGFTELKDKVVCLKDEWSSDYYRSIAEDYLQTTFQVKYC